MSRGKDPRICLSSMSNLAHTWSLGLRVTALLRKDGDYTALKPFRVLVALKIPLSQLPILAVAQVASLLVHKLKAAGCRSNTLATLILQWMFGPVNIVLAFACNTLVSWVLTRALM